MWRQLCQVVLLVWRLELIDPAAAAVVPRSRLQGLSLRQSLFLSFAGGFNQAGLERDGIFQMEKPREAHDPRYVAHGSVAVKAISQGVLAFLELVERAVVHKKVPMALAGA